MKTVKVINKGKRMRDRLGLRFFPEKEQTVEVNSRQYLTLKAVKDFHVEVVEIEQEETNQEKSEQSSNESDEKVVTKDVKQDEKEADSNETDEIDAIQELQTLINDSNIDEVVELVESGKVNVDEAIAYETVGKNRNTLLEKLEGLKVKEDE